MSVWRELAELHDAAGRLNNRDTAVRAALALDGTDGETREMAARWGIAVSAVKVRNVNGPPPLPSAVSGARPLPRSDGPGGDRSGPVSGLAGVGIPGASGLAPGSPRSGGCWRRRTCS